jgi:hypothetical protein
MLWMIVIALTFVLYVLYVLYLAYCTLRLAQRNGKLAAAPYIVQAVAWTVLLVALVLDVIFNVLIGSILFWEWPDIRRLTFTARCQKHLEASGRRGALARWVCDGWLNPFDAGHC